MILKQIFEPKLAQYSYLLGCAKTGKALIIDPQRDIRRYIDIAENNNLRIIAATETHIHADYLSGLREFAESGVKVFVSDEGGADWKYEWLSGSDYDYSLLKDGDKITIGEIVVDVLHTPGHTPEHIIFAIPAEENVADTPGGVLTGDFVFVGDVGRPDLLETAAGVVGSMEVGAEQMFNSLKRFKVFPESWQVWPGHGAGSACGKALGAAPTSTVKDELKGNAALLVSDDLQRFTDYILSDQPEPPMYFARMKRDNRKGPRVLGALPQPQNMSMTALSEALRKSNHVLLDTRTWAEFRKGHIKGALFTPFDNSFNTIAGCYVTEADSMVLLIEESDLDDAVVDLIRIGLDNIVGFVTPQQLAESDIPLAPTQEIAIAEYEAMRQDSETFSLDVRRAGELRNVGRIPETYNIAHTRLLDRIHELPKDKTLLVNCRSGVRSTYACAALERHGFEAINVAGGYLAWLERVSTGRTTAI